MDTNTNGNKKEIILAIFGVVLLVFAVIGVSYAVFTFEQMGVRENTIRTGTISFAYNETSNGISITNAQPMTDASGKVLVVSDTENGISQGYFDFNVSGSITGNAMITYEVYGTVDSSSTMDPNHVKVYLTDGSANEVPYTGYDGSSVPVYGSLPTATSDPSGKRLYTDSFSGNTLSKTFRLRLWVADTYTVADVSKTFTMRVNVMATG